MKELQTEQQAAVLTVGNVAKLYCLNWIDAYLKGRTGEVSILDLGCGTARNFVSLMRQYPNTRYVGVEPIEASVREAERNLAGLNGTVIHADAYDVQSKVHQTFDLVVSFSVLEHVYQRENFLRSARDSMKDGGSFLINYDAGHFMYPSRRERITNVIGPILARFGAQQYHQSFVHESEFQGIIQRLGLKVIDAKFFNSGLKGIHKIVPKAHENEYMRRWLDLELWLNETGIVYDDSKARSFVTRNFILQRE